MSTPTYKLLSIDMDVAMSASLGAGFPQLGRQSWPAHCTPVYAAQSARVAGVVTVFSPAPNCVQQVFVVDTLAFV